MPSGRMQQAHAWRVSPEGSCVYLGRGGVAPMKGLFESVRDQPAAPHALPVFRRRLKDSQVNTALLHLLKSVSPNHSLTHLE